MPEATKRPDDLIPATVAAKIAGVAVRTLAHWHEHGRIRAWRRPGFKASARLYSRAEIEALAPREAK